MKEFASYVEDIGRPYAWAQRLAGLQFLETGAASSSSGKPSAAVSSSHIAQTIRALRKRVEARLALQRQMAGFERAIVPVMPDIARLFPARIISRLLSWKPSTYEEFVVSLLRLL
ncbi:PREDICTED: THO complex subunit 5 homolog [Priapulus caudatus]|uniref:THO complex subunit 5 homolog n=1 Tax=Priapulus caudatus TaxID=37621 RepID=A0ABM1F6G8_PRICU|nr:PREDICTED: THO complex subunit 5 homolog [Priapulus caudatus]